MARAFAFRCDIAFFLKWVSSINYKLKDKLPSTSTFVYALIVLCMNKVLQSKNCKCFHIRNFEKKKKNEYSQPFVDAGVLTVVECM